MQTQQVKSQKYRNRLAYT